MATTRKAEQHDNFLADLAEPRLRGARMGYFDGFRFGLGFIMANLMVLVVLGALTAGVLYLLHWQ